ncbi:MAG: hypothetical protein HY744_00770 [Deltaproteobacteria bacterium]|nr:hypothetical protein [Deltaproteobacteria bacterium]
MNEPRFYELRWLDAAGAVTGSLAIDLLNAPSPLADVVERIAGAAACAATDRRLRTRLVPAPAAGAPVRPVTDYLWGDGAMNGERLRRHLTAVAAGQRPHRFTLRTGVPAEGCDLVGRQGVVADACALLSGGKSLHLMAPRRYGKTSLLRAIAEELRRRQRPVVLLEVESLDRIGTLAVQLAAQALRDGVDSLRVLPGLGAWPPADAAPSAVMSARDGLLEQIRPRPEAFLAEVAGGLADAGAAVLLDEFSRFLFGALAGDERELRRGLARLRGGREGGRGPDLVVAGSSGLRKLIAWHDLEAALGDLEPLALEPLSPQEAAVLVEELFYGHDRPPTQQGVHAVLDAVGVPIPYFLQALVHHALAEHAREIIPSVGPAPPVTPATVDRAYRRRLLDAEGNEFFRPFRLRERGYPDALRPAAAAVLARLAVATGLVSRDRLRAACPGASDAQFETLLAWLHEDYDVGAEGAELFLRSKVLRERWALREAWLTEI